MADIDRRMFVLNASALWAATLGTADGAPQNQTARQGEPPTDETANLNLQFRELYKLNREELLSSTPLAALMLIGTGEVWRIEFGAPVKSYAPQSWIVHVKGLMHAVIATQATVSLLERSKDKKVALAAVDQLAKALAKAEVLVSTSFPKELVKAGSAVIGSLRRLADGWAAGQVGSVKDFTSLMQQLQPDLAIVISAVGEAVYESVMAGLRQCAAESVPKDWERCLVGVCGVGFARRDNIEIAAAMAVLGRDSVGTRLLYLENAFTIPDGIRQLAAAVADLQLGRDVFNDPYRMWRDLLGDTAVKHVGAGFFPELGKRG